MTSKVLVIFLSNLSTVSTGISALCVDDVVHSLKCKGINFYFGKYLVSASHVLEMLGVW